MRCTYQKSLQLRKPGTTTRWFYFAGHGFGVKRRAMHMVNALFIYGVAD